MQQQKLISNVHYIYIIENLINNNLYIGLTKDPEVRWRQHQKSSTINKSTTIVLYKAFKKYGIENFDFYVINTCNSLEHAQEMEKYWIQNLKKGKNLYNMTKGGETFCSMTDKERKNRSKKMSGSGNHMFGKKFFGVDNPNYGKKMKSHVKEALLKKRRKWTDEQILDIRYLYYFENKSLNQIKEKYPMNIGSVSQIVNFNVWVELSKNIIYPKRIKLKHIKQPTVSIIDEYGNIFFSIKATAKHFNTFQSNIIFRLNNTNKFSRIGLPKLYRYNN
jgi:group I intron endonuclease